MRGSALIRRTPRHSTSSGFPTLFPHPQVVYASCALPSTRRLGTPLISRASMAFKYSCFISYCHGQEELMKGFMDQLKRALKAELEPLLDEEVYIDDERLKPGSLYNEALASAICESICMIVVYSPRYERHEYCRREFAAMESLEQPRKQMLGRGAPP